MTRMTFAAFFLAAGLVVGVFAARSTQPTSASHPWPYAGWGYYGAWRDLYPLKSGAVSWRGWTVDSQPLPQGDALKLIDAINNQWQPILNYILGSKGVRQFSFTGKAYNDSSAATTYVRMNTNEQVTFVCGNGVITACWVPTSSATLSGSYPALNGRTAAVTVTIPYGPYVWAFYPAGLEHTLAHEWGHGFGLQHHEPGCATVMSDVSCTQMPVAADGSTAISTVYGY